MTPELHDQHGSGFVHLRMLLPDAADVCPAKSKPRERRGMRGGRESSEPLDNAIDTHTQKALGTEKVGLGDARGKGRRRRGATGNSLVDIRCKALILARQLDDERSLAFYQCAVREVPEHIIRDALTRSLDVPRRDVRRSRAALFTSIIRPLLPKRNSTQSRTN